MSDFDEFLHRLGGAEPALRQFFQTGEEIVIARAPGRLDVMGGVADYSGSLVAQATIDPAAIVAIQRRKDKCVRLWSRGIESLGLESCAEISIDQLIEFGLHDDLTGLRAWTQAADGLRWTGYILGCIAVLAREHLLRTPVLGADIVLDSKVPIGAGLSSSAAIEVATMQALNAAYRLRVDMEHLAALAQVVENEVVGVPCGIMDQMACALGHKDRLFLLLCQPHEVKGYQSLPAGVRLYGIYSGVKHSTGGRPYSRARVAAFMGKRLINERRDVIGEPHLTHLAEITPTGYRRDYADILPTRVKGFDFIAAVGSTSDTVTTVDASMTYPVRPAVEHAVYENQRVRRFIACLDEAASGLGAHKALALMRAGECMYASHWSYTRIGLGSRETTLLVRLAREAGLAMGIYGARITGGGSGGTVAVLCDGDESDEVVAGIASEYHRLTGFEPTVVPSGGLDGAAAFGVVRSYPGLTATPSEVGGVG